MIGYPMSILPTAHVFGKVRAALQRTCDRDLKACDIKLTGLEAIAADKQSRFAEEWEEEGEKKRTQAAEGSITHRVRRWLYSLQEL